MQRRALAQQEALYQSGGYPAYRLAESLAGSDPSRAVDLLEASEKAGDAVDHGSARRHRPRARCTAIRDYAALLHRLGLPGLPSRRA